MQRLSGNVFGGGNFGTVFGNTEATIGSISETIDTSIEGTFYAGGHGINNEQVTVTNNSNGIIQGMNTYVEQYGEETLGKVGNEINIKFIEYKQKSVTNKYKVMTGINKATKLTLTNSYVYLSTGLKGIKDLIVPDDSGLMISTDSEIEGNFTGGGALNINNGKNLTIDGEIVKTNKPTTLIINPSQEKENQPYEIDGNSFTPYIRVVKKDNMDGKAFITGNDKYKIYNFNLVDTNKYNTDMGEILVPDEENPSVYKNSKNKTDDRKYYKEGTKYYLESNGLTIRKYSTTESTGSIYDERNKKYYTTIEGQKFTSTYFIEDYIPMESYIKIIQKNAADKVYMGNIDNQENVEILSNEAFSSDIISRYIMFKQIAKDQDGNVIKDENDHEVWEYTDKDKFLNVKRQIHLETNTSTDKEERGFPKGTNIIMITDKGEYSYKVDTEKNDISLSEFKNAQGEYQENPCMQTQIEQYGIGIDNFKKYDEKFRFIVDFSEAEKTLLTGSYGLVLEIYDKQSESEEHKKVFATETQNIINISNRKYSTNMKLDKNIVYTNSNIEISGDLNLENLFANNKSELGKNLLLKLSLFSVETEILTGKEKETLIEIPDGTKITLNESDFEKIEKVNTSTTLIKGLKNDAYNMKNIKINMDFGNVQLDKQLDEGTYKIKLEFYNTDDSGIIGKKANFTHEIGDIDIVKLSGYGIKLKLLNDTNKRNDENQLITGEEYRTIEVNYKKGNLDKNAYIEINTYKRNEENPLQYDKLDSTLAVEQKIEQLKDTQKSTLNFNSNLTNGTYKIEYVLYDGEQNEITKESINFIVKK